MTPRICLVLLLLMPLFAAGEQVSGLYEAEVDVSGENHASLDQAMKAAMGTVMVKLTGDPAVASRSNTSGLLQNAKNYVQQYRYRRAPVDQPSSLSATGGETERLRLWVQFDAVALDGALRKAGLPIWGRERPSAVVWLAVEQGNQRRLVGTGDPSDLPTVLKDHAAERAIPLILPLMDLEDETRLKVTDVWGGFWENIQNASRRYGTMNVLVGIMREASPGTWEARWTLYLDDRETSWSSMAQTPGILAKAGVDGAANILAERFARTETYREEAGLALVVEGITNVDQYVQVQSYLSSLQSVKDLKVTRVEVDQVTFYIVAHGGLSTVTQSIALGRILQPLSADGTQYRLIP